jgi:hypothetical protein
VLMPSKRSSPDASTALKSGYLHGRADAWDVFGCKRAAEEIRLKLPRREFHGLDAALRSEKMRNEKKADSGVASPLEPQTGPDGPVEQLTEILRALPVPRPTGSQPGKDPLDRGTLWSGPLSIDNGAAMAGGGIV